MGRKKQKGRSDKDLRPSRASVQSEAAALIERARAIAEERYGPNPSNDDILAIAERLCEGEGEGEDEGAGQNEDDESPDRQQRLAPGATECTTCNETDPAMFSQRMLNKRGRHGDRVRRCLNCVAAAELAERTEQARKLQETGPESVPAEGAKVRPDPSKEEVECAGCGELYKGTAFSRNQLQKARGGKAARCLRCVDAS